MEGGRPLSCTLTVAASDITLPCSFQTCTLPAAHDQWEGLGALTADSETGTNLASIARGILKCGVLQLHDRMHMLPQWLAGTQPLISERLVPLCLNAQLN